jgi:DNA-binding LytR/AlgR family response regulator
MTSETLRRTIKAVIIEDEPLVAKDLQNLLKRMDAGVEVLATLDSLAAARAWCEEMLRQNFEPDVIFCDIQLSDGVSFDLFKPASTLASAPPITCPVIFTTAYDEYALRAFKLNSIDYLLKPIDRDELAAALGKLERWRNAASKPESQAHLLQRQMESLLQDIAHIQTQTQTQSPARRYKERFFVHAKGGMLLVDAAQVACFLKDELIYLVASDGKRLLTDYETMEELEEVLNPAEFFRANRQTIINLRAVEGFKSEFTGKLNVALKPPTGVRVDVSREKASAFKRWLG